MYLYVIDKKNTHIIMKKRHLEWSLILCLQIFTLNCIEPFEVFKFTSSIGIIDTNGSTENNNNVHNVYFRDPETILHGAPVPPHKYPWQVLLHMWRSSSYGYCGAAIISDKYLLTAGHCLGPSGKNADVAIVVHALLGRHRFVKATDALRWNNVRSYCLHPGFLSTCRVGCPDMALIEKVEFERKVRPIRLPTEGTNEGSLREQALYAAGWGYTEKSKPPSVLQEARLRLYAWSKCRKLMEKNEELRDELTKMKSRKVFCLQGRNKRTLCQGDSGGSIVYSKSGINYTVGVISSSIGEKCDLISIHSSVWEALPWIQSILQYGTSDENCSYYVQCSRRTCVMISDAGETPGKSLLIVSFIISTLLPLLCCLLCCCGTYWFIKKRQSNWKNLQYDPSQPYYSNYPNLQDQGIVYVPTHPFYRPTQYIRNSNFADTLSADQKFPRIQHRPGTV